MRAGHVDALSRTAVSGWAADDARPHARLELSVRVGGKEMGVVVANRPRRDLAELGTYGDGQHGFTLAFAPALAPDGDHAVAVHFRDDGTLLPGGERLLPREDAAGPPMPDFAPEPPAPVDEPNPILVTAPGRSGTTYLMSCLAASPQVVVAELVPYEVRLLSYYASAYDVLMAPADWDRSTHPDRLEGDGHRVGSNPFTAPQYAPAFATRAALDEYNRLWAPARLGAAFADLVREYYRSLALDRGKGPVPFFAEKNNNLNRASRMFVRRAFATVREVVIVRDPRDVLCSHVAYFGSSQDKALGQLTHSCRQLAALADTPGGALHVLRYEDMVRGDGDTFDRLSAFLGARVAPVGGAAGEKTFGQHATSETPAMSVGRWRRDLPEDVREHSTREWSVFLEKFGYDLTV